MNTAERNDKLQQKICAEYKDKNRQLDETSVKANKLECENKILRRKMEELNKKVQHRDRIIKDLETGYKDRLPYLITDIASLEKNSTMARLSAEVARQKIELIEIETNSKLDRERKLSAEKQTKDNKSFYEEKLANQQQLLQNARKELAQATLKIANLENHATPSQVKYI